MVVTSFIFIFNCVVLILFFIFFFKGSHFGIYCTRYKHNDLKKKDFGAFKEILHHWMFSYFFLFEYIFF